jgi:TolB-like protein/class 3 adenylate cyclase/Flp pilus assembly protein TadD
VTQTPVRKLAVLLHADVVGSTSLVQKNETLAHERIQDTFRRFSGTISNHGGIAHEIRGDALVAEFARASDAVSASIAFQASNSRHNEGLSEDIRPILRVGIAMGEVIIADNTVTGEGIVLAQRLEQLAENGGVCIQGAAYETVPKRLPFEFKNLGDKMLKGFDDPVRVYRVKLSPSASIPLPSKESQYKSSQKPWKLRIVITLSVIAIAIGIAYLFKAVTPKVESASLEGMAHPLPDKPSIVVLPFINMSNDPSQEYFVDGMTEDLITDLAKIESLFVIARNTAFTYKDKPVVIPEVASELGVKYVLEGSVRRVADRVRINAQLIDGASGGHIWAERYDGSLADVFKLQDKVTGEIISALKITLTPKEQLRRERRGTENPDAHDAYLRGWQFYRRYTPEDFVEAIPHFERAVELDPDYGLAWAALASVYWISYRKSYTWTLIVNPNRDNFVSWLGASDKAERYLSQAMRNPTPLAHQIESQMSFNFRQFDKALSEAEQAIALDPNDPEGYLAKAWALIYAGRAEEAVALAETGMQLDPYYPASHLYVLGMAQLMMQQYTEAEAILERALGLNPENKNMLLPLTIAYVHLDKQDQARDALKQFIDFFIFYAPKIETYIDWWPFKREVDIRFFGGGLITAGLCCEEQLEAYIDRVRQGGTLE